MFLEGREGRGRVGRRAGTLLAICVGCSGAEPSGSAVPVATVELAALSAAAPSTTEPEMPPLDRTEATASTAREYAPTDGGSAPPPVMPALPAMPAVVATSTAKPATAADQIKLDPLLDAAAARDAPGMLVDVPTVAGRFTQGDVVERALLLQLGRCYTIVAASQGAVTELDVAMVVAAGPGMPPMVLAFDSDQGPAATLGRTPACFRNPLPIAVPVLLRLTVKSGSGAAAMRVFVK
jgi:hypothetical protein